jgi:hypothetical protein
MTMRSQPTPPSPLLACTLALLLGGVSALSGCGELAADEVTPQPVASKAQQVVAPVAGGPGYFVAIHNEPYLDTASIQTDWAVLKKLVEAADDSGVKLTLMFSAQWASFFEARPQDKALVMSWKNQGHEISSHRHSAYAGRQFDHYSDFPLARVAELQGVSAGDLKLEGDLDAWQDLMKRFDPTIVSGCSNDEMDRRVLPEMVRIDTCSGFSNYRQPGARAIHHSTESGINDFVMVGTPTDGVERRWLGHAPIMNEEQIAAAKARFVELPDTSVYGVVAHAEQADYLLEWFAFLEEHGNPTRSFTVREVIEKRLLPEHQLDPAAVNEVRDPTGGGSKQGGTKSGGKRGGKRKGPRKGMR